LPRRQQSERQVPPASAETSTRYPRNFHQALGALGDYPELLRRLGLTVRLRIPRPAVAPGSLRVLPAWNGQPRASDIAPRTRCTLDGGCFVAESAGDGELAGGLLDLAGAGDALATDTPAFDVVQVDADGAAVKAVLAAATLERRRQQGARREVVGISADVSQPHKLSRPKGPLELDLR
jgi:hypothetical protein